VIPGRCSATEVTTTCGSHTPAAFTGPGGDGLRPAAGVEHAVTATGCCRRTSRRSPGVGSSLRRTGHFDDILDDVHGPAPRDREVICREHGMCVPVAGTRAIRSRRRDSTSQLRASEDQLGGVSTRTPPAPPHAMRPSVSGGNDAARRCRLGCHSPDGCWGIACGRPSPSSRETTAVFRVDATCERGPYEGTRTAPKEGVDKRRPFRTLDRRHRQRGRRNHRALTGSARNRGDAVRATFGGRASHKTKYVDDGDGCVVGIDSALLVPQRKDLSQRGQAFTRSVSRREDTDSRVGMRNDDARLEYAGRPRHRRPVPLAVVDWAAAYS